VTGQTVSGPFEGHTNYVLSIAYSLDDRRIVSEKTIRVWDTVTEADLPAAGLLASSKNLSTPCSPGSAQDNSWNVGGSALRRGFLINHSSGWARASLQHSIHTTSSAPQSAGNIWLRDHHYYDDIIE
jgi:hypothetical protein